MKKNLGETYNAATPVHPSWEVYYTKALELNLFRLRSNTMNPRLERQF
jgi:hypothetical protein